MEKFIAIYKDEGMGMKIKDYTYMDRIINAGSSKASEVYPGFHQVKYIHVNGEAGYHQGHIKSKDFTIFDISII